jgi:glycosyltransferase involved in cell wall biosynthesis
MKVAIINKSDTTGGAAVVSYRLMEALRQAGVDARMIVTEKLSDSPYVSLAASATAMKIPFLAERLKIYLANGLNRDDLFKIDTASDGIALHNHPWVREADVVALNWVNQGMISLKGVRKLAEIGKPIVWTMHDMWCMTGICHHAGTCVGFTERCGNCRLLGSRASSTDLSKRISELKTALYRDIPIRFVAVSRWLEKRARESHLLRNANLRVIPNPFPLSDTIPSNRHRDDKFRIIFGAARLDDSIKGLPILVRATQIIRDRWEDKANLPELITFGTVRDHHQLDDIAIPHTHLGTIRGEEKIREIYSGGSAVVSTSHFETLPGTLVEGQAYGCVPVAFDRGGQRDIVTHRLTGYLAEYSPDIDIAAEHIAEGLIWAATQQSEEMRKRMRRSVDEHFSYTAVANAYIELFSSLC